MKILSLVLLLISATAFAEPTCINFDKENYCIAWVNVSGATTSNEYLRFGESTSSWVRMVTVKEYAGTKELKDFLPTYMGNVRPLLAMKADIFVPNEKKHKDEVILLLLLLAPDKSHYEYVVHRVYVDEVGPVRSVIFSLQIPFAAQISFDEVMANRGNWIKELTNLEPQAFAKIPSPSNDSVEPTASGVQPPASAHLKH